MPNIWTLDENDEKKEAPSTVHRHSTHDDESTHDHDVSERDSDAELEKPSFLRRLTNATKKTITIHLIKQHKAR